MQGERLTYWCGGWEPTTSWMFWWEHVANLEVKKQRTTHLLEGDNASHHCNFVGHY